MEVVARVCVGDREAEEATKAHTSYFLTAEEKEITWVTETYTQELAFHPPSSHLTVALRSQSFSVETHGLGTPARTLCIWKCMLNARDASTTTTKNGPLREHVEVLVL